MKNTQASREKLYRRGLIEGVAACSIVIFLLVISCWFSMGVTCRYIGWGSSSIGIDRGTLFYSTWDDDRHNGWEWEFERHPASDRFDCSFDWIPYTSRIARSPVEYRIPLWNILALYAAASAFIFFRGRRDGLDGSSGRCAVCGYDLTANTTGICPECGTPAVSNVRSAPKQVSVGGRSRTPDISSMCCR